SAGQSGTSHAGTWLGYASGEGVLRAKEPLRHGHQLYPTLIERKSSSGGFGRAVVAFLHALRQAPVDEFAIEWGGRFLSGRFGVLPGAGHVAGAPVYPAGRRVEQVIVPQGRVLARLVQRANARPRTFDLSDDNRAVEQVHRRALQREQGVVEAQDR